MSSIAVLGGSGRMGIAATRYLAESNEFERVVVLDISGEAVERAKRELAVEGEAGDFSSPEQLATRLRGIDILINCAPYGMNLSVMQACLISGSHYIDLGGLFHTTKLQLLLDGEFRKRGIAAVLGMGASPGLTNVAAELASRRLDEVREVHIRTGARYFGPETSGMPYSAKTILDEVTIPPVVFENGELHELEPLSGEESYRLPEPVGEVRGFYSIHSELATLPFHFPGVKRVTFRVAFPAAMVAKLKSLKDFGFLERSAVRVGATSIVPYEFSVTVIDRIPRPEKFDEVKSFRVTCEGKSNGRTKVVGAELVARSREDWNLPATAVWTGFPAAVAAIAVKRGLLRDKGVAAPEKILSAEELSTLLAPARLAIEIREDEVI